MSLDDEPPFFVWDREYGWGKVVPPDDHVHYFDSPVQPELRILRKAGSVRRMQLEAEQRGWWFDGDRWRVGRVDGSTTASAESYWVHFSHLYSTPVPIRDLYVRWNRPLADPLALLKAGTVETRFFHERRLKFLKSVNLQRSASMGLTGLLSSGVEIHEHQVGAARRVLTDPVPRYLLADEVGLGKTIEAGMVMRQLLMQPGTTALVIVPEALISQWEDELEQKFRLNSLPGAYQVLGHHAVHSISSTPQTIVVVDEAHRFTDRLFGDQPDSQRMATYERLQGIAHAADALLLLSATPVRSNEDSFLSLLHLLDPGLYPLDDLDGFRRRVEMRDELAETLSALSDETPAKYLLEPLATVGELLSDDEKVRNLASHITKLVEDGDSELAQKTLKELRVHVSEAYRLHRRMIRNRRRMALQKKFPVRGRGLAKNWQIEDPDPRREQIQTIIDEFRSDALELDPNVAASALQVLFGRALAPVSAMSDLAAALTGSEDHDLSQSEMLRIATLIGTDLGARLASSIQRVCNRPVELDRLAAVVEWARSRAGGRKVAVACSFPRTARLIADALTEELGGHRVATLLESHDDDERAKRVHRAAKSLEQNVLVFDRSAEEGSNLQFVTEVLHVNLPTVASELEQRLGRFDRWSHLAEPIHSAIFTEANTHVDGYLRAWADAVEQVFGLFRTSASTLQYVLADLELEFFRTAIEQTPPAAFEMLQSKAAQLEEQRRRIAAQDLMDSIEDRSDDELLAAGLGHIDSLAKPLQAAISGYVEEVLRFQARHEDRTVRFSVNKSFPPLMPETDVKAFGVRIFDRIYTSDRIESASHGYGLLRSGEPLVDRFASMAARDDRGRAFAVEVALGQSPNHQETQLAFCFDIKLTPDLSGIESRSPDFVRAVAARAETFMPTSIHRVWWMLGRGACPAELCAKLERWEGSNLANQPERLRELLSQYSWPKVCDSALESAIECVRIRPRVSKAIALGQERASAAADRTMAIQRARPTPEQLDQSERQIEEAVAETLRDPVFILESCGAVFITVKEAE